MITQSKNIRPKQAAEYLGLASSTLAKMRLRGDGPRFAKLGKRAVVYDVRDLDLWVEEQKRRSTSAKAAKING